MTSDTSARKAAQEAELSERELRLAIALAGVRPCRESPLVGPDGAFLAGASQPYEDGDVEALFRKGLLAVAPAPELTPEWKQALSVLADPLWSVRMALGERGEEQLETHYSQGPLTPDSLVYFRPLTGATPYVISFPYGPPDILALLEQAGFLATPGGSRDGGEELNFREYIALLTCLDVLRRRYFESLVGRTPEQIAAVRVDDLRDALRAGVREADPRWLVSVGRSISPFAFDIDAEGWPALMRALESRGYLTSVDDGWLPTEQAQAMRDTLLIVPSWFVIDLTMNLGNNLFEIHNFAALRGTNALWIFDFYALATAFPRVWASTGPGSELAVMFEYLVEDLKIKSEAALLSRGAGQEGTRASGRPPSPPTLRRLHGPATSSRLSAVSPATAQSEADLAPSSIDRSEAETVLPRSRAASPLLPLQELPPEAPPEQHAVTPSDAQETPPQEGPCPHCGLPVVLGKPFCRHCGGSLADALALPSEADVPEPETTREPEPIPEDAPEPIPEDAPEPVPEVAPEPVPEVAPEPVPEVAPERPPSPPDPLAWLHGATAPESTSEKAAVSPPASTTPPSDPLAWLRAAMPVPSASGAGEGSTPAPAPPEAESPLPVPATPSRTPTCGVCALPVPEAARFCGHCGANVTVQRERTCPSCNGRLAPKARFCAFCGHAVAP